MENVKISQSLQLEPSDNFRLSDFCGECDQHLRQIEQRLNVEISNRGNQFQVTGIEIDVKAACAVIEKLFAATEHELITPEHVHLAMQDSSIDQLLNISEEDAKPTDVAIKTKRGMIRGRGKNQQDYLKKIQTHDINFGIGPAGTGKLILRWLVR